MKIRYCIAPALLGLFLTLTACVEKTPVVEETAPAIKILKGEMMLPPTGGEDAFLFESENEVKAVADYPSWCHVTVGQGRINVKVDDYDGIESRYSGVTLTAADQQFRLTVQQKPSLPDLLPAGLFEPLPKISGFLAPHGSLVVFP